MTFALKTVLTAMTATTLLIGCGGSDLKTPSELEPRVETEVQTITAETIAALPEGEILVIDTRPMHKLTVFDRTSGEIDYRRVELICPNGNIMQMDQWIAKQVDVLGSGFMSGRRSVLAADPYRFGLNDEEVRILKTERFYAVSAEFAETTETTEDGTIGISRRGIESSDCYYCCDDGIYDCDEFAA